MLYTSTRGLAPKLSFADVVLTGLASDGGLYVPETFPTLTPSQIKAMRGLEYTDLVVAVMTPFVGNDIDQSTLKRLAIEAYFPFRHQAIAPLKQLDKNLWLMELFHGPTLAFKDYALQFLGRLFDHLLLQRGQRITIVGATSGDTGSAAIEACRDKDTMDIFILHPHGRTSDIQRRQMTTVLSSNVHNIAVEGTFDDCQDIVKALFNDAAFRVQHNLSAVNSINWARILAQVVYYFWAALHLGAPEREVAFAVPTGNFGNVFAAYVARKMGLPITLLGVASNRNDILTRFFATGTMQTTAVEASLSPSMDIQVSSNFERLLFDLYNSDGLKTAQAMQAFRQTGKFSVSTSELALLQQTFVAHRLNDLETKRMIADTYHRTGELIDPHTAVGLSVARQIQAQHPELAIISLACAHPAKFPDTVLAATGITSPLPDFLADLLQREERVTVCKNNVDDVKAFIQRHVALH